jgi:hypothetical protein
MRQAIFAATLILLSVPSLAAEPPAPLDVHAASPLLDMHLWARKLASGRGELPALPGLPAAVEALRALDVQLGHPPMPFSPDWGVIDLQAVKSTTAGDFALAVSSLPESYAPRGGQPFPLRAGVVRLAEAYRLLEKPFLEQVWPWHQKMIERSTETLRRDLLPRSGEVFAEIHRTLGSPVPAQPIPVYLTAEAPYPGGATFALKEGGGLCLVGADASAGSQWLEVVIHESIHALDVSGESALDELRKRLEGLDSKPSRGEVWDFVHTVMFAQAGETVRRILVPGHRDYGEVDGYYPKVPAAAAVVVPAWQAWMRGSITREAALDRIVEGFRTQKSDEKEKGDPKAAPIQRSVERRVALAAAAATTAAASTAVSAPATTVATASATVAAAASAITAPVAAPLFAAATGDRHLHPLVL